MVLKKRLKNERFTVACSRCRQNVKFLQSTGKKCTKSKWVPHVQHDHVSSLTPWFCGVVSYLKRVTLDSITDKLEALKTMY